MPNTTTQPANRIAVKITCDTGATWVTEINGTLKTAINYFKGVRFVLKENDLTGEETFCLVTKVEQL